MEKIASFTVDHTRLLRGIYVSRKDYMDDGEVITTFDISMMVPIREPEMSQGAMHTIEHLAATYLRNHAEWGSRIVYWGPMGCCTGNYLLVKGDYTSSEIAPLVTETFKFIETYEGEIPGANAHDCGNYSLNNLPMARWEARKYVIEVLENLGPENLNYPE